MFLQRYGRERRVGFNPMNLKWDILMANRPDKGGVNERLP
jgi:hypothetical protein